MAKPNGNIGNYILENNFFKIFYGGIIFSVCLLFICPVSYLIYLQFQNKDNQREVQTYFKEIKELEPEFDDNKNESLIE
jgi:hypothetical protein